jgi:hypothetical protein
MSLLLTLLLTLSAAAADSTIVGHWLYYKKIFRDIPMPEPPHAPLRLRFDFFPDGTNRLYWWREGQGDWCERMGKYRLEDGILEDKVTWVNPRNSAECARDPDMQLGRVTRTPVTFVDGDFHLHLHLGDDPLCMSGKRWKL